MKEPEKYPSQLILIMDLEKSLSEGITKKTIETKIEQLQKLGDITTIIIKPDAPTSLLNRELIASLQEKDIAVLIEDNIPLAQNLKADGVHLSSDDEVIFEAVLTSLDENQIVGITAGQSRHKAMIFAESGCSYVAINLANRGSTTEQTTKEFEENEIEQTEEPEVYERPPEIEWWAELFGTPCVAWNLKTIKQAETAIEEGADFLALAPDLWQKEENQQDLKTIFQLIEAQSSKCSK